MTATQPDCVVLCVNPFDEISYIRRTILYIESSIDTKVISIVVFPMDISANQYGLFQGKTKLGRENYNKIKKFLNVNFMFLFLIWMMKQGWRNWLKR